MKDVIEDIFTSVLELLIKEGYVKLEEKIQELNRRLKARSARPQEAPAVLRPQEASLGD